MVYNKRPSAPTNTIKLTLDFRTLDKLRALASARKMDTTRCAYELLQAALESVNIPDQRSVSAPEPEDRIGELITRVNNTRTTQERP